MDENEEPIEDSTPPVESNGGDAGNGAVNTAQNVQKTVQNVKNVKKTANAAKTLSLAGPLMTILFWVFVVIIAIIIIVGLVMFFVTMPGMVMEKLKALAKEIGDSWSAWFGDNKAEISIEEQDVYDVLDYLHQMGYDLKGFGFLTDYATSSDLAGLKDKTNAKIDKDLGVIFNTEEDKIVFAESDFIFSYLVSENYIYTIKNFNLKGITWWTSIWDHISSLFADNLSRRTGMLVFYHDNGSVGGTTSNTYDAWERGSIEVNAKTKELVITKGWFNGSMTFSLDGWTGRYGMPLDFLLSVHMATMMPDLAYDMADSFQTEIKILLHAVDGTIRGSYKTDSGSYIKYTDMSKAINGVDGEGWFSSIIADIDEWGMSEDEAQALIDLGVKPPNHPDSCGCTIKTQYKYIVDGKVKNLKEKTVNGEIIYYYEERTGIFFWQYDTIEVDVANDPGVAGEKKSISYLCSECKEYLKLVVKYADAAQGVTANFSTYMPYIENVTDHWYRDVYFISNSEVKKFVDYDYEYEAMMKERWTLYETYTDEMPSDPEYSYRYTDDPDKVGEFIVFQINENGDYLKENGEYVLYNGTFDEARGNVLYEKQANGEYVVYTGPMPGETVDLDGDGQPDSVTYPTLYRKDAKGEFVEYNKDTDEPYAVAKKAILFEIKNEYEDLNWNELNNGMYSAYSPKVTITTDYPQAFKAGDSEYENASEYVRENILSRIFHEVKIGVITQTGEGQRTETNTKIKKMFLTNKYFRYDGNTETAEIITKLRQDNDIDYGPLEKEDLEKSTTYNGQTYYVKDYAGTVTLNQDSLNQFSILENTHTLDADYIYRDFKELVVELGYFEKEELTDETPRLLEFLIPAIGSSGYPDRTIDKRENEFGTMIHSKYDIEANKKYTLRAMIEKLGEEKELASAVVSNGNNVVNGVTREDSGIMLASRVNNDRLNLSANPVNITEVGAIGQIVKKPSQVPIEEFLKTTREMCEYINEVGYDYCVGRPPGTDDSGRGDCICGDDCYHLYDLEGICYKQRGSCSCPSNHCKHDIHGNYKKTGNRQWSCTNGLRTTFEQSQATVKDHNLCCATLVSWALQNVGVMPDEKHSNGVSGVYSFVGPEGDLKGKKIERGQPLQPGDILFYDGHVDLVGERKNGGFVKYNGGHQVKIGAEEGGEKSCIEWIADWPDSALYAIRLDWGKKTDAPYEGFLGNEEVVSPVTGILLEYGTYTAASKDNISNEEYRVNVDLKYGPSVDFTKLEDDSSSSSTIPEVEEVEKRMFSDKVGYAKILVLNKETFEMLESQVRNKWSNLNNGQGLLNESGNFTEAVKTEDDFEAIEDDLLNQTIYGIKEFAELYEKYGIAGNVIYIDGFKTELPDENFFDSDEDGDLSDESGNPKGEALHLSDFQSATSSNLEQDKITSSYEAAEEYKLPSEEANIKLNVEEMIKTGAAPAITINNPKRTGILTDTEELLKDLTKLVFIKEGTVLGRTYVDRELVETRINDWGDDPKYNFDYYNKDEETIAATAGVDEDELNLDRIIGNYIRVIMRDHDDTVVENVEDYMKLDNMDNLYPLQEYVAQPGDLQLLANLLHAEGCGSYFASKLGGDEELGNWASQATGYVCINRAIVNYGGHGTTIRDQIAAPGQYSTKDKVLNGPDTTCEVCLANAEWCLTYDCMSIQSPAGEPMPRNCLGQSGWCQCANEFECWWWVDTTGDGEHTEANAAGDPPYDTFYCINERY